MKTFIISCFYQCLVRDTCWPTGQTFQADAETEEEALNKVINRLYDEWKAELYEGEEPEPLEEFAEHRVTIYPVGGEIPFADEQGWVLQISELIKL